MTNKSDADDDPSKEFEDQAPVRSSDETLNRSPQNWVITEYNEAMQQLYSGYVMLFDSTDAIPQSNKEKVRPQVVRLVHNATRYQAWVWEATTARILERLSKTGVSFALFSAMFLAIPSLLLPAVPLCIRIGIFTLPLLYLAISWLIRKLFPQTLRKLESYVQTHPSGSHFGQIIGTLASVLMIYLAIRYRGELHLAIVGRVLLQMIVAILFMSIAVSVVTKIFDTFNLYKVWIMVALCTLLIAFAKLFNPSWSPWILHPIRSALLIAAIFAAVFPLSVLSSYAILGYLQKQSTSKYPRGSIIISGLDVLRDLQSIKGQGGISGGGSYVFHHEVAQKLGIMASTIERSLSQELTDKDPSVNLWLQGRSREIAQAVRERKKRIILSGGVDYNELKKTIGWYVVVTATGEWALLDHVKVDAEARPSPRQRFWTAARWLAITLWPLVVLVIIARAPLRNRDTLLAVILPVAISWIGMQLISLLDPRADEKLARAVEISSKIL